MKTNEVAIIDFGSSKISCFVATPTNDGFVIKASGQSKYGGYGEAEWYEKDKLFAAVQFAVNQAEENWGNKIRSFYIGVPGEFTSVATSEASLTFRSKKKITKDDITELFDKANIYESSKGVTPISRSSIYYTLEDGSRVVDPVGSITTKIVGLMSFIFMSDYFRETVGEVLRKMGIDEYEYVSSCLAESLYLVEPSTRDNLAILLDVGYISSSVMLIGGDGLMFLKSFSIGSGHISADLCQVLEINFTVAEQLRNKINLNLEFEEKDNYTLPSGTEINAYTSNEVVKARIEDIADYIIKCFDDCQYELASSTPVFITGGGLAYTKGAIEYLSKLLNKPIKQALPMDPQLRRAEYTSSYGLIDIGIKQTKAKKFFKFKF